MGETLQKVNTDTLLFLFRNMEKKMKNVLKLTAAVIIAALVFAAACDNGTTGGGSKGSSDGGNGNGDNTVTFNLKNYNAVLYSISEFREWLPKQPANTAAAPYKVALLASDLSGGYDDYTSVGNVLYTNPTKFVSLDLSYSMGIIYIDDRAFRGCGNLISIILSNKVTGIGKEAFRTSSLTSVTIPASVLAFGERVFTGCTNLTSITFKGTINKGSTAIPGSPDTCGFISTNVPGDSYAKFYTKETNGTPGTYTTIAPVGASSVWTKMP
jgi:hypothetical protein